MVVFELHTYVSLESMLDLHRQLMPWLPGPYDGYMLPASNQHI